MIIWGVFWWVFFFFPQHSICAGTLTIPSDRVSVNILPTSLTSAVTNALCFSWFWCLCHLIKVLGIGPLLFQTAEKLVLDLVGFLKTVKETIIF